MRQAAIALRRRIAAGPAGAEVHRGDEDEASREESLAAHAGDRDRPVLERLPQCLERRPSELAQLVQEEHAAVGEGRLAGARTGAAADDRGR
jgi:hypothetical protein